MPVYIILNYKYIVYSSFIMSTWTTLTEVSRIKEVIAPCYFSVVRTFHQNCVEFGVLHLKCVDFLNYKNITSF